ncbi:MAG: HlyD family efflux transporter periplasmic adaptor subunit [Pseudomonadota bacterium]
MRLKKRPRVDALANEVRARRGSLGRWLYLGAIATFVVWLGNLFAGELLYFRADGLVLLDRVVIATQYPASIEGVSIEEGDQLTPGQPLLTVRSQSVEETLAALSSELAVLLTRAAEMRVRAEVIEAITPVVHNNLSAARAARASAEDRSSRGLFTDLQRAQLSEQVLSSVRADAEIRAERAAIAADLPTIEAAVARAENALAALADNYAGGALNAPTAGVVGYLHVAPGSVVRAGEPIMEIFHGEPFVLALVPEGALYAVEPGDEVHVQLGFDRHDGVIDRIYPVTAELPPEFADRFNQQRRAPLAKIRLAPSDTPPTLFARTRVSAKGWPPAWFKRLIGLDGEQIASDSERAAAPVPEALAAAIDPVPAVEQLAPEVLSTSDRAELEEPAVRTPTAVPMDEDAVAVAPDSAAPRPTSLSARADDADADDAGAGEPAAVTITADSDSELVETPAACADSKLLYWLDRGGLRATRLEDGTPCERRSRYQQTALKT